METPTPKILLKSVHVVSMESNGVRGVFPYRDATVGCLVIFFSVGSKSVPMSRKSVLVV